ncbi:hypothetical protein EVB27_011 [Rhizobium phage RHph_TM16]|nr:hypothetical protein EVB27_011 [Rhizobium phage RHph_TM16]
MAILLTILRVALSVGWKVAKTKIPIPLGLIAAAVLAWFGLDWWDTTSAVKKAVEARVHEMVTGAEKEKLEAQLAESAAQNLRLQIAADTYRTRMAIAEKATQTLEKARAQEDIDDAEASKRIAALEQSAKLAAARANPACPADVVDPDIFGKLHNNR